MPALFQQVSSLPGTAWALRREQPHRAFLTYRSPTLSFTQPLGNSDTCVINIYMSNNSFVGNTLLLRQTCENADKWWLWWPGTWCKVQLLKDLIVHLCHLLCTFKERKWCNRWVWLLLTWTNSAREKGEVWTSQTLPCWRHILFMPLNVWTIDWI